MLLMDVKENVSLASYSTMRLGGNARYLAEAKTDNEVQELVAWAKSKGIGFIVIGGGSNIVWRDEGFPGLVIVDKVMGKDLLHEDDVGATVRLGGGENWDESVAWTVKRDLSGIEFLSLIPGTVGAAPVQNIGAYGGELSRVLKEVAVYDTQAGCFESILNESCGFSYRDSRFKSADKGRFVITHIVLELKKTHPQPPFYESLQTYFDEHDIREFSPSVIRESVIAIRSSKLPDPAEVANNGSFFTNPTIEQSRFDELKQRYPEIKGWPASEGRIKLAAGWLVEQAGFKGIHDEQTGMATWGKQALVLVNEHAHSTSDLLKFKQKIVDEVQQRFGLTLEQEPELLP